MATERTSSRAFSDIVRQLVGRAFNLALGVVVTAVIARLLGERGFGEWSSVLVVAQIAAYLSDLGIDQVGVERAAAEPEREAHWIGATVALRALVSIPATLISVVAVILVAEDDKMLVAGLIVSLTILLSGPNTVSTLLQLRLRNDLNVAVTTAGLGGGGDPRRDSGRRPDRPRDRLPRRRTRGDLPAAVPRPAAGEALIARLTRPLGAPRPGWLPTGDRRRARPLVRAHRPAADPRD
jgi:hypothetical protein